MQQTYVISTVAYTIEENEVLFFRLFNGVTQGNILSPKVFSLYMDNLTNMLKDCDVDSYTDNVCVNKLFFAVDLSSMAPCVIALQQLLTIY